MAFVWKHYRIFELLLSTVLCFGVVRRFFGTMENITEAEGLGKAFEVAESGIDEKA